MRSKVRFRCPDKVRLYPNAGVLFLNLSQGIFNGDVVSSATRNCSARTENLSSEVF